MFTVYRVVEFVFAEHQGIVGDCTRVELASPNDLPLACVVLFMVTFDEDIPSEGNSRGDGDTHFLHVVCHIAETQNDIYSNTLGYPLRGK